MAKAKVKNISLRVVMVGGTTRIIPEQTIEIELDAGVQRLIDRKILQLISVAEDVPSDVPEPVFIPEANSEPIDSVLEGYTVEQLKAYLTQRNVSFSSSDNKATLFQKAIDYRASIGLPYTPAEAMG